MSDKLALKLKETPEPLKMKLSSGSVAVIPSDVIRTVKALPENAVPGQVVALVSEDSEFSDGFYIAQEIEDGTTKWAPCLVNKGVSDWNDLENKPFGEKKHYPDVICDETATDRVVTEPFLIPNFGDGFFYVKVGELPAPAKEYLSKLNSFILSGGQEYRKEIIDEGQWVINEYENATVLTVTNIWFIVAVDVPNTEINGGTFPESGLYFLHNNGMQIGVQKATFEGVILIDEKYLPDIYITESDFANHKSEFEVHKSIFANYKSEFEVHKSEFEVHKSLFADHKSVFEAYKSEFEVHKSAFSGHFGNHFIHLPETTATDEGKFLRVDINGRWVAEAVPNFEESEF